MKKLAPEQYLTCIGDITVSFSLLELSIQDLIGSLINESSAIGKIVTSELSFKNLRALAISLYIEKHGKDKDYVKLKSLMKKASEVEKIRNNIIHSIWVTSEIRNYIVKIKTISKEKQGLHTQLEKLPIKYLSDVVQKIKKCAAEILGLMFELIENKKAINHLIGKDS